MNQSSQIADRFASIDIARGIIMVIMAIDHASKYWNANRPMIPEGAIGLPIIEYANLAQQLTREITHICAPGFQLLAGMGLAIFVKRRIESGLSGWAINKDLIIRGLALCFCDFVIMYWAYGKLPMAFLVLACIGCNIMLFSALRYLPAWVLLISSIGSILALPLLVPEHIVLTNASRYPINALLYVAIGAADGRSWLVIYPILPWIGSFGIGWCLGQWYERLTARRSGLLVCAGLATLIAAFLLRWHGGTYADRIPSEGGPLSASFWIVSKYPPAPVFLLATVGSMLMMLGLLRRLDFQETPRRLGSWLITYGRAPLFFYIAHFHLFWLYPFLTDTYLQPQASLGVMYIVWAVGVLALYLPCAAYQRMRLRYGTILRYF